VINVPNVVTVARVFLALITLALLFSRDESTLWTAFGLTIVVIWADGLDGFFARKLKQVSTLGAVLDIAGDRAVEMSYWIVFASLGWIPVWVPLLFLVRGIFVDAMRAHASEQGFTAFGAKTMMQTGIGKFLVASNFSRFTYAVAKAITFCLFIASRTSISSTYHLAEAANVFLYISCAFCVIRGLPVLLEAPAIFRSSGSP
jgi:CDP-diacylglycerol--glycerol-3-phosphate 3-phosphatidyltransferase